MNNLDDDLATEYLSECREHLATIETNLLALENTGTDVSEEGINRICRAVHSIKVGAGFFDLVKIRDLAQRTADVLVLVRSGDLVLTPDRVSVLLRATDRLKELVQTPGGSNRADIAEIITELAQLPSDRRATLEKFCASTSDHVQPGDNRLRSLLVEDDFASRLLLQTFLSRYGECHIAVNGKEAVDAFSSALGRGQRYDLICMDIMMPVMDGREAVRQIRAMEEVWGFPASRGATIIMTTAVTDIKEVIRCFKELCDSYLTKPIDLTQLLSQLKSFQLVK